MEITQSLCHYFSLCNKSGSFHIKQTKFKNSVKASA